MLRILAACFLFLGSLAAAPVTFSVIEGEPYIFPVPEGKQGWVATVRVDGEPIRQAVLILGPSSRRGIPVGRSLRGDDDTEAAAEIPRLRAEYAEASKKLIEVYVNLPEATFFTLMQEFTAEEQAAMYSLMSQESLARYMELMGAEKAKALSMRLARQRSFTRVFDLAP